MQGKMKSFFEDTGIILVLSASIYGGYYIYNTFFDETVKSSNITELKEKKVLNIIDSNESNNVEKILTIKQPNKEATEVIAENTISDTVVNNKIIDEVPAIVDKIETKKEKNVDLGKLRTFLRDLKFKIATNIVKRDDLNESISQKLKIRVTVLKDGNYEELTFVNGDEKLFEMNKENIINIFPVQIDEKIKDDFPRYVRISIK